MLKPGERKLIPTGLTIALPDGYEAQVRPRSGLALKHGVTVANAPGTVDADYRGEVGVILLNLGQADFTVERGMRIAQMIVAPYTRATFAEVAELPSSERGTGGFGSTGIHKKAQGALMLVPSKKLFYAVEAVLFIAYNGKTGPIAGSEVAAQQGLPARYLEPLMQKLVKAGILKGVRGPQGGYILGRERRRISVEGHLRRAARGARAAAVAYRARAKSIDA